MNERTPPMTEEDLVRIMADLFDEVGPETPEEVNAALREFGYDPDEFVARGMAVIERAIASSPFNWRNRAQALEEERARLKSFAFTPPESLEEVRRRIKYLVSQLTGDRRQLAFQYRSLTEQDLKETSREDLVGMLKELEYLLASQERPPDEEV